MLKTQAIVVIIALAVMVGTGSLAIATGLEQPVDIKHVSDAKIHLQDVDGKINTNVPIIASRAFSPLPVYWTPDPTIGANDKYPAIVQSDGSDATSSTPGTLTTSIVTKSKILLKYVTSDPEAIHTRLSVDNNSEDRQIFTIKATTTSNVLIDIDPDTQGTDNVTVHGILGINSWLLSVAPGTGQDFLLEITPTNLKDWQIELELLRVG